MISASGTTGLDGGSHVVLAVARLDGALHLLGDPRQRPEPPAGASPWLGARRQRAEPQPLLLGGGEREPGVLERELERERRRVLALHNQLALQVRAGRPSGAAAQRGEERLGAAGDLLVQRTAPPELLGQPQQPRVDD